MPPNNEEISRELIEETRRTYFLERRLYAQVHNREDGALAWINRTIPHWDGGTDSRGVRHKPVWPKIVQHAWKHNIHPVELIKGVFARWVGEPPSPTQFIGSNAIKLYQEYKQEHVIDLEFEFESFKEQAKKEVWKLKQMMPLTDQEIWRAVITSPNLKCGPLYKFSLALSAKQNDLALYYRHCAMLEYLRYPDEYDVILAKELPEEFRQSARRLCEKLARL
jgi:hypothetical protein